MGRPVGPLRANLKSLSSALHWPRQICERYRNGRGSQTPMRGEQQRRAARGLGEDLVDDVTMHIGQTPIDAVMAHGQARMIEAQ